MESIHIYQPGDYAKDAVTMLALALDLQLKNDNSSNDLHEHIASTEFMGETVRLDETLSIECVSLCCIMIHSLVQGRVQVNSNGDRLNTMTLLYQYRPLNSTTGMNGIFACGFPSCYGQKEHICSVCISPRTGEKS